MFSRSIGTNSPSVRRNCFPVWLSSSTVSESHQNDRFLGASARCLGRHFCMRRLHRRMAHRCQIHHYSSRTQTQTRTGVPSSSRRRKPGSQPASQARKYSNGVLFPRLIRVISGKVTSADRSLSSHIWYGCLRSSGPRPTASETIRSRRCALRTNRHGSGACQGAV
jgi:hypothetical protein